MHDLIDIKNTYKHTSIAVLLQYIIMSKLKSSTVFIWAC